MASDKKIPKFPPSHLEIEKKLFRVFSGKAYLKDLKELLKENTSIQY